MIYKKLFLLRIRIDYQRAIFVKLEKRNGSDQRLRQDFNSGGGQSNISKITKSPFSEIKVLKVPANRGRNMQVEFAH